MLLLLPLVQLSCRHMQLSLPVQRKTFFLIFFLTKPITNIEYSYIVVAVCRKFHTHDFFMMIKNDHFVQQSQPNWLLYFFVVCKKNWLDTLLPCLTQRVFLSKRLVQYWTRAGHVREYSMEVQWHGMLRWVTGYTLSKLTCVFHNTAQNRYLFIIIRYRIRFSLAGFSFGCFKVTFCLKYNQTKVNVCKLAVVVMVVGSTARAPNNKVHCEKDNIIDCVILSKF